MIEKNPDSIRREEDYRDYEERDINDGWPYADATPGSEAKIGNGAYGEADENFDEAGNPGFQRSDDTVIKTSNIPDLVGDDPSADVDDDALEEAIAETLSDRNIDMNGLEIKASRGVVELTGTVDSTEDRRKVERLVSAVLGVVRVRSQLSTLGVDTGIPGDWDD
ncbi:BON domain-containing protein [Pararhizobium gei]|uniref:BON domain-containing protein n=1 Tax=Pararhizobium gei TaxID=1395951 RepID=UPI0023DCB755|nr:BON domain-containing protein [Rhizobium gei]